MPLNEWIYKTLPNKSLFLRLAQQQNNKTKTIRKDLNSKEEPAINIDCQMKQWTGL